MNFLKRIPRLVLLFLLIELLDELVYGAHETAWPLIRADLHLDYAQIGLALSLPGLISVGIEPLFGILGGGARRRALILGGGVLFALALVVTGLSNSFVWLLAGSILFHPASGAFVSLSQASLMDLEPGRHEQNMARWTFAGSLGVFLGPLLLGLFTLSGWGWRGMMLGLAAGALLVLALAWRGIPPPGQEEEQEEKLSFRESARRALNLLKRGEVLRWLLLLEFSDLMLDVLYNYLALYLVDVVQLTPETAALGVAVWTGVGLLGDFLLIPLLERVRGLDYLRVSVVLELVLFPAFLLSEPLPLKLAILGLLGFFNSGWYSILKGQLYSEIQGQSAAMLVLDNTAAIFGKLIPLAIGLAAQRFGLASTMWLLLAGPIALLLGLPRRAREQSAPPMAD
jgi:FSR family fosmidomycin resistance protein-like MFS transporter